MTWIGRLWVRYLNRPDRAAVMQRRPVPVGTYSYEKAVAGARRAQAGVEAERKRRRFHPVAPAPVTPIETRRR